MQSDEAASSVTSSVPKRRAKVQTRNTKQKRKTAIESETQQAQGIYGDARAKQAQALRVEFGGFISDFHENFLKIIRLSMFEDGHAANANESGDSSDEDEDESEDEDDEDETNGMARAREAKRKSKYERSIRSSAASNSNDLNGDDREKNKITALQIEGLAIETATEKMLISTDGMLKVTRRLKDLLVTGDHSGLAQFNRDRIERLRSADQSRSAALKELRDDMTKILKKFQKHMG